MADDGRARSPVPSSVSGTTATAASAAEYDHNDSSLDSSIASTLGIKVSAPTATVIASKLLLKAKRATKATNPSTLVEIEAYYNRRLKVLQERLDVSERKYQNQRHLTNAAEKSLARVVASSVSMKVKAATSEAMMSRVKEASEAGVRDRTMARLKVRVQLQRSAAGKKHASDAILLEQTPTTSQQPPFFRRT